MMARRSPTMVARTQIAPRPIYCITSDVHNDRALAEAVCEGRFTHAGITLQLGIEPDWLGADLPHDDEWRIEWHKFYYGLDLANAYLDHGDARFLEAWESLVRSWIHQMEVGLDESDVAARRMQNWTYAWSLFSSAPGFPGLDEGLAPEIRASLEAHVRYVRDRMTPDVYRNHRTLELYSLFVVALAFPQIDPGSELLTFTIDELHRTLVEGFRADGVHREGSTHYHLVVLRSLLGARENARRFELDLPDGFDVRLERACEFALHCHRPDGLVSALSDADSVSYPEVLTLAASLLNRPDFRYAATTGAEGSKPKTRSAGFPASGYFVQRSGWGSDHHGYRDERFLVFDCGPLGDGGHGHYDLLSVEAYGYGRPLVVDPGRYTYSEDGANLRRWFKGTAAHNTVCVDGKDQTPYKRGRPGPEVAAGHFIGQRSAPGFEILEGRAESPCYDALHTRRVIFVDDEYWIVEDELSSEQAHDYDLRWHLSPEAWGSTDLADEDGSIVVAPGLALVLSGNAATHLEPGWVSPRYGFKEPAPVVRASAHGKNVRFLTLIAPRRPGQSVPRLTVVNDHGAAPEVTQVVVEGAAGGARDRVTWGPRPVPLNLGPIECTAGAAWLRESETGRALSFRGLDAAHVSTPASWNTAPAEGTGAWVASEPLAGSGAAR